MNSTDLELKRKIKCLGKPKINTARQTQTMRVESPGKLTRKTAVVLAGMSFGLILICLLSYWAPKSSAEQIGARTEIFIVNEPTKLAGPFFGVAFGKHRIQGEFLDKKRSNLVDSAFFLSDANGTPFTSDLPTRISVDKVTARLGYSTANGVSSSIHTRYALKTSLRGRIVVFADNASGCDVIVVVDSETIRSEQKQFTSFFCSCILVQS